MKVTLALITVMLISAFAFASSPCTVKELSSEEVVLANHQIDIDTAGAKARVLESSGVRFEFQRVFPKQSTDAIAYVQMVATQQSNNEVLERLSFAGGTSRIAAITPKYVIFEITCGGVIK